MPGHCLNALQHLVMSANERRSFVMHRSATTICLLFGVSGQRIGAVNGGAGPPDPPHGSTDPHAQAGITIRAGAD